MENKLSKLKQILSSKEEEAYILVDYENRNPLVKSLLGNKMLTRKVIICIPKESRPFIICHLIDYVFLNVTEITNNYDLHIYKTWPELLELETKLLSKYKVVLMDISKHGLLPRISLADYGSVKFIEEMDVEIHSSGDVLQEMVATLSTRSKKLQDKACELTLKIKDEAFNKIREDILIKGHSDEYSIQSFICKRFTEEGMVYDEAPIVAIGPNASNPHYGPTKEKFSLINKGDLVLIDMWAKMDDEDAVYADITWMGYVGNEVPQVFLERFEIVKAARDGVIEFLSKEIPNRKVAAFEADDVARKIITEKGFGQYFTHRVGHNIGVDVSPHGPGANLDNYETHDDRTLLNDTSFSDEPGIYAPDFGLRLETDLRIDENQLKVVGGLQTEIIKILG